MYNEKELTPAQQELEAVLRQIRPNRDVLNQALFLFNAGRASTGGRRPWQMLSGVLTVLMLCSLLIRFEMHAPPQESEPTARMALPSVRFVEQSRPEPVRDASAYLVLRERVVQRGLDGLPPHSGVSDSGLSQTHNRRLWLERLL